jgi:HSP20 family protein
MAKNGISPLRDFMSLREAMDRVFDDRWVSPGSWLTWTGVGTQYLPLDVYETADEIVVRALVPGVGPEGIDIEYQHGTLTIRTDMASGDLPEGGAWLLHEMVAAQAVRQIALPPKVDVDQARTSFENGVLTLTLPKSPDAKPRQIKVGSAPQIDAGADS